jgi:hypothetical protein
MTAMASGYWGSISLLEDVIAELLRVHDGLWAAPWLLPHHRQAGGT